MEDEKDFKKIWAKRIQRAREVHKKLVVQWFDKVIKEYAGEWEYDSDTGEKYDQIAQVVHAVEETIQPSLFFQSPRFNIEAKRPEFEKREDLVEAIINQEYRDILPHGRRLELENELALIDARILPYGGTKTSYMVEGTIVKQPKKTGILDKIKNFMSGEDDDVEEVPVGYKELGHVTRRFDPLKVFIDPDAKHITEGKYVIEEIDATKEDLMASRYDQEKVKLLKPDVCLDSDKRRDYNVNQFENYLKENPDSGAYRVYEIHDLKERVIHTYSEQIKDFIEENSEYPIDELSQYNFLWFVECPNRAYPIPPIKFYRRRAIEFSYIYTQIQRQIDKFLPKIGVDGTKLIPQEREKLKTGNLATIFETVGPPAGAVQQFNFTIQRELFEYLAAIKDLMNLESGANDYETGNPEERKATEAQLIQKGTSVRRFKPKKRVKEFLISQGMTILRILQKNQSDERFVKVLGKDNAMEWFNDPETGKSTWTSEMISGDYLFDIDVESITPVDSIVQKAENEKSMATVLNPALRQGLIQEKIKLRIAPIFKKYAKENLGIEDQSQVMEDISILTGDQENTAWMSGQVPPITPEQNHEEHLMAHMAFVQSPGFQVLPEELKVGPIRHIQQTEQVIAQQRMKNNQMGQQ